MIAVVLGLLVCFWLFVVDRTSFVPPNATVLVDPVSNTFFAPPEVPSDPRTFVVQANLADLLQAGIGAATQSDALLTAEFGDPTRGRVWLNLGESTYTWDPPIGAIIVNRSTLKAAKLEGATPDESHQELGAFMFTRSNARYYLENWGIMTPRWSADGRWNW